MMGDITYRHPREHEALEIFQEGCRCFDIGRFPYSLWLLDEVRKLITKPNIAWIAEMNERLIGFVGAHARYPGLPDDHGFLEWCFVLPEYRRRGICLELVKKVEQQYSRQGKHYIVTNTTPDNDAIQNYLQKEGYEIYAEDVFYRKKLSARPDQNSGLIRPTHDAREGTSILELLQSPERFVGSILYAIIIAQLLVNFRVLNLSLSSILVFAALFITIGRWGHLHVSLTNKGFQYYPGSGLGELAQYWFSFFMLAALFFSATYQADLKVVCFSIGGLIIVDLLWELNAANYARRNNHKPMVRTANRWIVIDLVSIPVLAGILYFIYALPQYSPWSLLSGAFYQLLFFLLMLTVSVWDYVGDYVSRIGFYFLNRTLSCG